MREPMIFGNDILVGTKNKKGKSERFAQMFENCTCKEEKDRKMVSRTIR